MTVIFAIDFPEADERAIAKVRYFYSIGARVTVASRSRLAGDIASARSNKTEKQARLDGDSSETSRLPHVLTC